MKQLESYEFNINYAQQCIDANKHNHVTTTYYLLLKKYSQCGGKSPADINCETFDHNLITPNTISSKQEKSKKTLFYFPNFYFTNDKIAKKKAYFNNNLEQSCEKSQNSKNKFDNILEIISNEMVEKNLNFKKKMVKTEKENSTVQLIVENNVENPKHTRYKSLISKIPKENNADINRYKIPQTHKYSQNNKSVDLEKNSDLISSKFISNNLKTPPDPKIQSKALYGYFFPNNYQNNQSTNNNINNSGYYLKT